MIRTTSKAALLAAIVIALPLFASAAAPQPTDLTNTFRAAGAAVDRLQVYEISGIVIIRGRTADKAQAELLGQYAQSLGYARVANLVQIAEDDDAQIARMAERELTIHRSLDGCHFHVTADRGVVHVAGTVRHELQKDVAVQVLRGINGVRAVEVDLNRF